jgi:hypothetical protein
VLGGALVVGGALSCASGPAPAGALPGSLTSAQFWELSESLSEPGGYFRSDNLVSNEHTFQYVIPGLVDVVEPGGVYLGVAPDQNFTYIAATRPHMAFIVDVRRGNLLLHLLYKALFELSADRAEFVSRLFSKPRPDDLGPVSRVSDIFNAFAGVGSSEALYRASLAAVQERLAEHHGFPLSAQDLAQIESIFAAFFRDGPAIRYSMSAFGRRGSAFGRFPSFEELAQQTDWMGVQRGYLASEDRYRTVRRLHQRNLVVPVVGNFAGPKALQAVGDWVRDRGSFVTAFYVSNVEQYLYQDGLFETFAGNVATLPVTPSSTFIRSVSSRYGYRGPYQGHDGRASALYPIRTFLRDFEQGRLRTYYDLNARSR